MDNSSTPAGGQSHQKPTIVEPTVIMMRLTPAQADRMYPRRGRNNDDPRLDRMGCRLRRMTEYSYPYMPHSHYLETQVYGEPTVVIPNLNLPPGEEQPRDLVHFVYNNPIPRTTSQTADDEEQQLPEDDGATITKVVCLTDMLSAPHLGQLLEDDEFYDRFVDDVEVEACQYGELVKLVVPRTNNVDPAAGGGVGKVFLQYACRSAAYACKNMMDRSCWKGHEQIVARFYPEDKFAAGDYGSGQ